MLELATADTLKSVLFEAPFLGAVTVKHTIDIGYLIVLEGLLSFDNALALAALVKSRLTDPLDQKRALAYGIWGAYFFRTIIVFVGVWLMQYEWVKAIAGGYLVWLAISHLFFHKQDAGPLNEDMKPAGGWLTKVFKLSPLWSTIVAVELMDLMFSVDSIGVALAISDVKWVLVAGAVLGIVMMRFAATGFVKLIDKFPILEKTAFVMVGYAGLNVLLKLKELPLGPLGHLTIEKEIPEAIFTFSLFGIFVGSLLLNLAFPKVFRKEVA
jgi:YkoY family integral membrane protein